MTKIPWTEETWNPVIGCTKIAAGCKNCYAEKMAIRLKSIAENDLRKNSIQAYKKVISCPDLKQGWNGNIVCREDILEDPLHWKKSHLIFVCSMGDLFHEKVSFEFIDKVMAVIALCPQHTFQILTKRPERMAVYYEDTRTSAWANEATKYLGRMKLSPPYCLLDGNIKNLWLGTSISTQPDAEKNIPILLQIPAAVRFISIEPMLESIDLKHYLPYSSVKCSAYIRGEKLQAIDWVIIGCESGPGARLCSLADIDYAIDQCRQANVPLFLKQIPLSGKCEKDPAKWPKKYQCADLRQYPKGEK